MVSDTDTGRISTQRGEGAKEFFHDPEDYRAQTAVAWVPVGRYYRLVKGGPEPFLVLFSKQWHGFHFTFYGRNYSHDPEDEKAKNYQDIQQRDDAQKAREKKPEHLAEMKSAQLRLLVAVQHNGDDKADQCDIAQDGYGFIFSRGDCRWSGGAGGR
jgi:hypothetical protein